MRGGAKQFKPRAALKHGVRVVTAVARACFWLVCYYYFGPKAVFYIVAAWAFVLAVKNLTSVRVRLNSIADPARRVPAMLKSAGIEAAVLLIRVALIAGLAAILRPVNGTVSVLVAALIVVPPFWARELLTNLLRSSGLGSWARYVTITAALTGVVTVALCAERGMDAVGSATLALVLREAVAFSGLLCLVLAGRVISRRKVADVAEDDDDDDDAGAAVSIIDENGRELRSTFAIFIADNVVYSRWRVLQFGTRLVANGLLGPFGSVLTRLFFIYRKPGAYVHREAPEARGKLTFVTALAAGAVVAAGWVAQQHGLLQAFGIAIAAFVLRAVALGLNVLLWRQLKPLIGRKARIKAGNID